MGHEVLSEDIKDGEIVNADISASAAIALSKLAGGNPATREKMFSSFRYTGGATNLGYHRVIQLDADGEVMRFNFFVPHNFTAITEVYVIVYADDAVSDADIDIDSEYGANGEDYNTHTEADTSTTYNFSADVWSKLSLAGILSSLVAGDRVGVNIEMKEAGKPIKIPVQGLIFKYT